MGERGGLSRFPFSKEEESLMNWLLVELVGFVSAQAILYQVDSKEALKTFWFLGFFYFFLFSFVQGLHIFCGLFFISFYEVPLLALALFLVFGRGMNGFPSFQKAFRELPDFYLVSGLWISLAWRTFFPHPPLDAVSLLEGFFLSLWAALMLPVLAGIKERLALYKAPEVFRGLPLLLITAGVLLLGVVFFSKLNN